MKTVKLICALFALLGSAPIWADEEITLLREDDANAEAVEDRRSLVCEPTATIDGSCISIYSDVAMTMTVSIYDAGNQLVQQLPLLCVGEASFTLTSLLSGEYRIEISCGEELYYGWFTLY